MTEGRGARRRGLPRGWPGAREGGLMVGGRHASNNRTYLMVLPFVQGDVASTEGRTNQSSSVRVYDVVV